MISKSKTENASTDQLLTNLDHAVDEAKLVRSLIQSKDMAHKLKKEDPFSQKLIDLNRETAYLEAKLAKLRSKANKR